MPGVTGSSPVSSTISGAGLADTPRRRFSVGAEIVPLGPRSGARGGASRPSAARPRRVAFQGPDGVAEMPRGEVLVAHRHPRVAVAEDLHDGPLGHVGHGERAAPRGGGDHGNGGREISSSATRRAKAREMHLRLALGKNRRLRRERAGERSEAFRGACPSSAPMRAYPFLVCAEGDGPRPHVHVRPPEAYELAPPGPCVERGQHVESERGVRRPSCRPRPPVVRRHRHVGAVQELARTRRATR